RVLVAAPTRRSSDLERSGREPGIPASNRAGAAAPAALPTGAARVGARAADLSRRRPAAPAPRADNVRTRMSAASTALYPDAAPVNDPRGRPRVRWHDLLAGLDGARYHGDPDVEITAITHDSRRAVAGACFACIPGAVTDGHEYAPEA